MRIWAAGTIPVVAGLAVSIVRNNHLAQRRNGPDCRSGSDAPPLFLVAADLTVINVEVNAGENGIGEIKPGDKATFTVEAFSGRW